MLASAKEFGGIIHSFPTFVTKLSFLKTLGSTIPEFTFLKILNFRDIFDIHLNYYSKLISLINPKIVLTFDSYNEQYYKLKKKINRNIKFIAFQKTPIFTEFKFFKQDRKFNSCDIIFSFGNL